MKITNKKTFNIEFREAGSNSYYIARCGEGTVYSRKTLSSLGAFIKSKGHDIRVDCNCS